MCQAREDYGRRGPGRRAPPPSCPRTCVKCKEASAVVVIRVGDAFCRACFREYFVHKFRAMLGKNRVIFPGEKVLLALSGGPASSAMLRQVQEGLSRETAKRLRFVPGLVYVDEGAVCGQSPAQREENLARVEAIVQATGFPFHLAHLEQAFDLPGSILRRGPRGGDKPCPSYKEAVEDFIQQQRQEAADGDGAASLPRRLAQLRTQDVPAGEEPAAPGARLPAAARTEELLQLFEAAETLTAKEELLQMLRTHLILHTARTQGYTKVMMGDSCTRVAVKLLTNLALGRGAFLAMDTGFMDSRHGDVAVVRPMREYMAKEIAFYNHFFGVSTVITPALRAKRREKTSIHRLMEDFLLGLQAEFPSTISTVYRTGEKLSTAPAEASSEPGAEPQRCLLCLCALDTLAEEDLALEPTLIAEEAAQRPQGLAEDGCCHAGTQGSCCQSSPTPGAESRAAFLPLLCYSCRLTFKEMGHPDTLPPYVRSEAQRRSRRAEMKQQIQEFLLEDDDEDPSES
ncbi:cytoplasmic tRNA 2-thiolation protein 2 [Apteryx mantelli]|uniref:Cytoplasmic tRNA 2-thiolation protein 2 n=1 Tax=Apteryx mantelli TaxID=2696672 RepID=A0ABM4F0J0_9AVES